MRGKRALFVGLGLLLALAILATACGGVPATSGPKGSQGAAGPAYPAAAPTPTPAPRAAANAISAYKTDTALPSPTSTKEGTDRMIVRTANVSLVVKDVAESAESVAGLAVRLDGFVVSSSIQGDGDKSSATVTIRVPVSTFDEALGELRRLAVRVASENTNSEDVSEEYVDLDARLRNLEATERQYLALLDRASVVEDVLKVQREMSSVRGQIEQMKARLQYLERTAAMSLITANLSPASNPKPLVEPGWSAPETFKAAVRALTSTGQTIANGLIRIGVFSAIWLPIVGIVVAAGYLWRRSHRRST